MTDRERLLEILNKPIFPHEMVDPLEAVADYLLDNGVTFATDNNVGNKWIPVSEQFPEHFGVFIVAIKEPGKERVGKDCADFDPFAKTWLPSLCWDHGYKVTHWMELPEPPQE